MLLSIIIVNWNVIDLLSQCLDSIQQHLLDIEYEVIVIDNASSDGSVEILKQKFPCVRLIENHENAGFAKANNQGFKIAQGKYILILNPDTVIHDNAIQKMIHILDHHHEIGMVGPRIVDKKGRVTPPCRRKAPSLTGIFLKRFLLEKLFNKIAEIIPAFRKLSHKKYYQSGYCGCIQGACMLVRKKDLDYVGFFDENAPMYLDDNDICWRFSKAGFKIFFCADSEITHIVGASVRKSKKPKLVDLLVFQATDILLLKHKGRLFVFIHHIIVFLSSLLFLIIDFILLPIMWFFDKKYIFSVIEKHYLGIYYSLLFKVKESNFKNSLK